MPRCTTTLRLALVLLLAIGSTRAQSNSADLSDKEVEQLRESAYLPNDRVLLFLKFLDLRTSKVQDLFAHPRKPGREQDTHDLLEQFTALADELEDNLDDYGPHHRDIRKALPKLLEATDRWATAIKSPPEDDAYAIPRKLALESIRDLREDTTRLIAQQRVWFLAHPPQKQLPNQTIDIPR